MFRINAEVEVPSRADFDALVAAVHSLQFRVNSLENAMATIQQVVTDLTREIAEVKGANASAKTLIVGLVAKVNELAAAAASGQAVADELAALATSLSDETDALAAAVAANPIPDGGGGSGPVVA